MIATDVSGTEKNDRYWASGSGDFFYDREICLAVAVGFVLVDVVLCFRYPFLQE
jgi:hypothetical protein